MKRIYRVLYCLSIAAIVAMPLVLTILNMGSNYIRGELFFNEPELSGFIDVKEYPHLSLSTVTSGKFQTEFEEYFSQNLAIRKTGTRVYNQLLYSLFASTDNASIIVGRDKYLYEKAYPVAYLAEISESETAPLTEKIEQLVELNHLLKDRGVALVVRMSPSKAEHYPEYLPTGYDRFIKMKRNGEYLPQWYEVFKEKIQKTDIPFYDRYDLYEEMKQDGHTVFTVGGIHWTLAPIAEYVNGLNALIEKQLGKKLGRIVVKSEEDIEGEMGIPSDSDLWDICWNALSVAPDYPSPNITLDSIQGEFAPNILNVGQSFSTALLNAIYHNVDKTIWNETYFSWYNSYVLRYPNSADVPWGERISEKTDDFDHYLNMDVIIIEFLESTATPNAIQFEFVSNMLNYLKNGE